MKSTMILCLLFLCLFTNIKANNSNYQIYFFDEKEELIMKGTVKIYNEKKSETYQINYGMIQLTSLDSGTYHIQLLNDPYQQQIHQIYIHENKQMKCNLYYKKPKIIKTKHDMMQFYMSGMSLVLVIIANIYLHYQIKDHS